MKKILVLSTLILSLIFLFSCSGDGSGSQIRVQSARLKSASISGAKALAVAHKTETKAFTKADNSAADALYKVSSDGKFIEVTYTFDIEVEEGEGEEVQKVVRQVQAHLRIQPNFIFAVGDDWLWLANCYYYIPGYAEIEEGAVKKSLTQIRDQFNEAHHDSHGAQYLIRKSNGAMYAWENPDGAPYGMPDGYNPPSMLNDWFFAIGNKIYVREGGFHDQWGNKNGRVICISDGGSSLNFSEVIPASEKVNHILPGQNGVIGVICEDGQYYKPKVYFPSSSRLVDLTIPEGLVAETARWSLVSVAGKLYAVRNYHHPNGMEEPNKMGFYNVVISEGTATVGSLIAERENAEVHYDSDQIMVGAATNAATFTYIQDGNPVKLYTFDPEEAEISVRNLPAHYPAAKGWYIDGIACNDANAQGFWVCDLSRDEAEYIALDWSGLPDYQSRVTSMVPVHFEAACMAEKYTGTTSDGDKLTFWVPVTGANAGKVTLLTMDGDGGYDISVLLNM